MFPLQRWAPSPRFVAGGKCGQMKVRPLHKKWSFLLRISSVNVTKSTGNCGFCHIYWINPSFFCAVVVQLLSPTMKRAMNIRFFLYSSPKLCMPNFVGRVPSWTSWFLRHCAIVPSWLFHGFKTLSLLLGNRISSLITEIYRYWKTRAWLYCKVFNKKCNIVILLSKWGQNFDQILLDNQRPALLMLQFTFTVQLCILVWESYVDCNILIMLFSSFL